MTSTWDPEAAVHGVLDPDEVVLWSGGPIATRGLDRQDVWFIVVGIWLTLTYWGVAYFASTTFSTLTLRVLPPAVALACIVMVRPVVRRSQSRRTTFVLTPARALVLTGPPFRKLETATLPSPHEVWRRTDGRGTITFGLPPSSTENPFFSRAVGIILHVILFLLGLAPRPPQKAGQLVFYEVSDIDDVVQTLEALGQAEVPQKPSRVLTNSSGSWSQVVERRFTPTRRVICGLLGFVLVATTVPVIAVRLRDYLQHSPTLSGPSTVHLALPPATYVVFEHAAKAGLYDCSPVSLCVTIDPLDVSVTSQSGAHLYVYVDTSADAITDGSDHYAGALKFNVHQFGTYSLSIRSSAEASFVIAKQPSEEAFALGGWIAGGVVGLLLIAVALVGSLIARGSRRRYRQVSFAGSLPMGTPTAAGPPPHD